jgi:hypothetical protein
VSLVIGADSKFGSSRACVKFQRLGARRPNDGISPRWGFTLFSLIQLRAKAPWAIESHPFGADHSSSSPNTLRQAARCGLLIALLAAAGLAVEVVHAQDKSRRAERRSRRSGQSAEADTDRERDTASAGPNKADAEEPRKTDGEQSPLTLHDVIKFAAESRDAVKEVKDFTALFSKTEMVKGKLIKQEMQMKFRAKPFSVYFLYRGGSADGRQAIYVDGRFDNKLVVKEASGIGSYLPGGVQLRLNDPRVVAENRYPVTHVGIANLLETTIHDWEKESKVPGDEVDVQFFPHARLKDIPCQAVQVIHLKKFGDLKYHMNRVYFDKETRLPVRAERYGWPAAPGEKPPLLEEYRYTNLRTNVNLTDADFDPVRCGF